MTRSSESEALHDPWPLVWGFVLLLLVASTLVAFSFSGNGELTYALDDAYIHLSVARNVIVHHVWGVTPYGFSSSVSSLLWPVLLALLYVPFRAGFLWMPLVLNVLAAAATLALVDRVCRFHGINSRSRFAMLTTLIFLGPMAAMIAGGMEHQLHALLTLGFVAVSANEISRNPSVLTWRMRLVWYGLAVLLAMSRYEGLFTIACTCALLVVRGRIGRGVWMGLVALAPIVLFGLLSVQAGWNFLPNSLLLKSPVFASGGHKLAHLLGYAAIVRFSTSGLMLLMLVVGVGAFFATLRKNRDLFAPLSIIGILYLGTLILHANFSQVGWLARYEAYLVEFMIFFVGLAMAELHWSARVAALDSLAGAPKLVLRTFMVLVLVLAASPLVERLWRGNSQAAQAMNDRYLEHVTPARFVNRFYNDVPVTCNDIGALSYFTRARLIDLWGLGDREPLRLRKQPGGFTREDVYRWTSARGSKIAILQVGWEEVADRIPAQWTKIGEWRIPRNVIFHDTRIGFYATDPAEGPTLAANLAAFSREVPASIQQSGFYRVLSATIRPGDAGRRTRPRTRNRSGSTQATRAPNPRPAVGGRRSS